MQTVGTIVGCNTTPVGCFYALSNTTGQMKSKKYPSDIKIITFSSVRDGLRNGTIDFGGSYWSTVFYENFEGDPNDLEKGFLRNKLLVLVSWTD